MTESMEKVRTISFRLGTVVSGFIAVATLILSLGIAVGAYRAQNEQIKNDLEEAKRELKTLNAQVPSLGNKLESTNLRLAELGEDVRSLRDAILDKKK